MPLNMNTVGTGNGIGGNTGTDTVVSNYSSKFIDHSQVIDMSSVTFGTTTLGTVNGVGSCIGNYGDYFYGTMNYSNNWYIYRYQLPINTNNTTNPSKLTATEIVHEDTSGCHIINGCMYYSTEADNFLSGYLYKLNLKNNATAPTKVLPNKLNTYYDDVTKDVSWGLFASSSKKINNSNYLLYTQDATSTGYFPKKRLTLIEDNDITGAKVIITSVGADIAPSVSYGYDHHSGLVRLYHSTNLGIYNVEIGTEYVDIYTCMSYVASENGPGVLFFDKVLIRISKESKVLTLTLISSDKVHTQGSSDDTTTFPIRISSETSETQIVLTSVYSNDNYYFARGLLAQMTNNPTFKLLNITPSYYKVYNSADFPLNNNVGCSDILYYQGSYQPALLFWRTDSSLDVGTIDMDASASVKCIENIVTIYLYKGDIIRSDSGIKSYKLNGHTTNVDSTSLKISNNGLYEIHVEATGIYPECIVYTKEGTILGCGIKFIDDTHITGYFNKGMSVNGVKTTKSGYQTIAGTFNGRVTISK